ncbi:hypothetical protein VTN00DRAFT_6412 [Thermoascus crustaceus]|uniref:uncharacterized protein n=1 Tax=Thermoascus crustaceus TaxID=5088 RepID=UPI0037434232
MAGSSENDPAREQNQPNNQSNNPSPPPKAPRNWHEEENPFVAFRRYADEQISNMLHSVMGLPSLIVPPSHDRWMIYTDESGYRDYTRQRRSGDDQSGGDSGAGSDSSNGQDNASRYERPSSASTWTRWSDWDDFDRWRYYAHRRPFDLFGFDSFFDRPWFEDRFPFSSFGLFRPFSFSPFFPDFLSEHDSSAWPVPYILFSPYSPLHLERQSRLRANREKGIFSSLFSSLKFTSEETDPSEPRWREAFEDLLRLENGKPMLERETQAVAKKETGNDWLRGLVERGSLGDRWKYVAGPSDQARTGITLEREDGKFKADVQSDSENADSARTEAMTELDLYDRFLQDIEAREREYFRAFSESPLMRLLFDERRRMNRDEWEESRRKWMRADAKKKQETENWLDQVSGEGKTPAPEAQPAPSTEVAPAAKAESAEVTPAEPRVVSTRTSVERIRLPDGSIKTKTVKTRRFADGREETNEDVEVRNPSERQQHASNGEGSDGDSSSKGGWFWK